MTADGEPQLHDAIDGGKHKAELEEAEFQRLDALARAERKQHEDLGDKVRTFRLSLDRVIA